MLGKLAKTYLDVVKLPVRAGLSLVGKGGAEADRFDAALRENAGEALGDEELRDEGRFKRQAADDREQAAELKADAKRTAAKKKQATREATAKAEERREERAREERRKAIHERAEALDDREKALRAADEADRLGGAAERAKAARKSR